MKEECVVICFSGELKSGRRLFESFVEANRASFWNASLISAIGALSYSGFVRPATLFVSAPAHHLESLRTAYAKRMLKSPAGYSIISLGDMGAIRAVPQLLFVPLTDAFCDAVSHLNRCGRAATLATVREHIGRHCEQVPPPTEEMLAQTARALSMDGLIHRVGRHFFVAPVPVKTTVECQTGDSIIISPVKSKGIFSRLFQRKTPSHHIDKKAATLAPAPVQPSLPPPDWQCSERLEAYTETTKKQIIDRRTPRRRRDRRARAAPKECNYGPIDPPECVATSRKRHVHRPRASTPIESDSAYSRSPSDSDGDKEHTYINLNHDETNFEDTISRPVQHVI